MPPARQADPLTIKRLQRGEEPWHIEIIKRDCTILSVPYTINRAKLKGLGLTLSEQDRRSTFTSPLYNNGKKCYAMLKCSPMPEEDASVVNNLVLHDLHPFIHSDTKMRKHVLFLVSNVKRLLAARKLEKAHDFPDFPDFHDMPQDHHLASFTPPPEMQQVIQKVKSQQSSKKSQNIKRINFGAPLSFKALLIFDRRNSIIYLSINVLIFRWPSFCQFSNHHVLPERNYLFFRVHEGFIQVLIGSRVIF